MRELIIVYLLGFILGTFFGLLIAFAIWILHENNIESEESMKILVDSLPFYMVECPFTDNCPDSESGRCRRYWSKYDVVDNGHECYWLKEQGDEQE